MDNAQKHAILYTRHTTYTNKPKTQPRKPTRGATQTPQKKRKKQRINPGLVLSSY